jgi:predicted O-methyltransferase YrrM
MNPLKFMRELAGASHYRSKPGAALRYAYAKWMYFRFRQHDPLQFLSGLGIDPKQSLLGFDTWRPKLEQLVASIRSDDGRQGGIGLADGIILYGLARALRPEYVIETGVAAGVSTSFLGAALIENGGGQLFSIELPASKTLPDALADGSRYIWQDSGVGWAIPEEIKFGLAKRHQLILQDVRTALPYLLKTIPHVDLFFHDDLHTPDHMIWEYEMVWPRLSAGGILVSDDANYGWIEFCKKLGRRNAAFNNVDRLCGLRKTELPAVSALESVSTVKSTQLGEQPTAGTPTAYNGNQP